MDDDQLRRWMRAIERQVHGGTSTSTGNGGSAPHNHDGAYAPPHGHPYAGTAHNHDAAYAAVHQHPYEPSGAVAGHVAAGNPHPAYAAVGHSHTPAGIEAWKGNVIACAGNGDPGLPFLVQDLVAGVNPTPTNISVTFGRCQAFILDAPLTVNRIRWRGVGATASVYRVRFYRDSDSAAMCGETPLTTTAAWNSVAPAGGAFALAAGTLYWAAVAVNAAGTTAGIQACLPQNRSPFNGAPNAAPGNLAVTGAAGKTSLFQQAQVTVAAGALPATMPARSAPAAWTGGMPQFWLDNNSAP